jgi:hypothetical protein
MAILILDALMLTSALLKSAPKMPFASTLPEVMIANANKVTLEIHLKCVHQFRKVSVKIHQIASAVKTSYAHQVSNVIVENARICVKKLSVALELLAMVEHVCVLLDTMAIQMTLPKAVLWLVSVRLMPTAKIPKFVSKTVEVSENALKVAVRFSVVQTHFALLTIIVQLVFALKDTKETPLISTKAATKKRSCLNQKVATLLLAVETRFAKLITKVQSATVWIVLFGIQFLQLVKNHQFLNALAMMNVIQLKLVVKMF